MDQAVIQISKKVFDVLKSPSPSPSGWRRRAVICVLGKNDDGVCTRIYKLPRQFGCNNNPGTYTPKLTQTYISIMKAGLQVAGFAYFSGSKYQLNSWDWTSYLGASVWKSSKMAFITVKKDGTIISEIYDRSAKNYRAKAYKVVDVEIKIKPKTKLRKLNNERSSRSKNKVR